MGHGFSASTRDRAAGALMGFNPSASVLLMRINIIRRNVYIVYWKGLERCKMNNVHANN